jgi:hypothetical protein
MQYNLIMNKNKGLEFKVYGLGVYRSHRPITSSILAQIRHSVDGELLWKLKYAFPHVLVGISTYQRFLGNSNQEI